MPFVGIGVGIGRQRFASGIFAAYAARVAADGGVTEAGACVNAVSGISLNSSLLLVPSGYKSGVVYSQIPTNGDGDLTFTRASDATRVNSDGLIEGVRTNLILQSNQFDTTWTNLNTDETSGQSGYDGTSNAWLLEKSASGGYLRQTGLTANAANFSVFVKANDSDYVLLAADFGTRTAYFDLQNGVVGNTSAGVTATIVFISNGWYRCSASFSAISDVRIYPAENNVVSASSGSVFIQNAQLETGDIATDYIPTTTAAVSVGMTANVPRLDYSQGSCPALLLEPQRTNLVFPSGTGSTQTRTVAAVAHTLSFFGTGTVVLSGVAIATLTGTGANNRATLTFTPTAGSLTLTVTGTVTRWQLEAGSYPTSYIPTTSATVTRLADSFSRNNIYTNGLITSSGGTWFVELKNNVAYTRDSAAQGIGIGDSSTTINNGFLIVNTGTGRQVIQKIIATATTNLFTTTTDTVKIAIKWNGTDADVFVNGVKEVSATAFTTTLMEFLLANGNDVPKFIQAMQLYPTPLSDSDCISLTT